MIDEMKTRSICRACPANENMYGQYLTYPAHSFAYDCEYRINVVLENEFVKEECAAILQIYPEPAFSITKDDIT